jgi:XTP/dITP diphosphohydrolase
MNVQLRFVSRNPHKIAETAKILGSLHIDVRGTELAIEELQTTDSKTLVRDKALKAFRTYAEPLFVEHTGLYLAQMNGLPGGLTQIFWDTLKAERFCDLFGRGQNTAVEAKTILCYLDGKRFHFFEGAIEGKIAAVPKGPPDFQWDCIFVPDGRTQTFAELGDAKNEISMRRKALDKFVSFLKDASHES